MKPITLFAASALFLAAALQEKVECSDMEPGVDLSGCNLSRRIMAHANLSGAILTDAEFDGATWVN